MTTMTDARPRPAPVDGAPLLVAEGITVRFGGVVANDSVSLDCPVGSITALIGPNGAGKSTFFDVVTGARRPNAGRVMFRGLDVTRRPPHVRARLGMARTFQNLAVVRSRSVLDNVVLGASRYRSSGFLAAMLGLPRSRRSDASVVGLARRAVALTGLEAQAHRPAGSLPHGDLRRLEIARALALGPKLLMLDEPAAGMDATETAQLAEAIQQIRDRWGITVLLVEHDVGLVRTVADYVHVIDFGKPLASGVAEDVLSDARVIRAYLGATHA